MLENLKKLGRIKTSISQETLKTIYDTNSPHVLALASLFMPADQAAVWTEDFSHQMFNKPPKDQRKANWCKHACRGLLQTKTSKNDTDLGGLFKETPIYPDASMEKGQEKEEEQRVAILTAMKKMKKTEEIKFLLLRFPAQLTLNETAEVINIGTEDATKLQYSALTNLSRFVPDEIKAQIAQDISNP